MSDLPRYLTYREVAEMAGVSFTRVVQRYRSGRIRAAAHYGTRSTPLFTADEALRAIAEPLVPRQWGWARNGQPGVPHSPTCLRSLGIWSR